MKSHASTTKSFIITLLIVGATFASAQFVGPTTAPPGGNVSPPLNTGGMSQIKSAALGLRGLHISASSPDEPNPPYLLDVDGPAHFGPLLTAAARVTSLTTSPVATANNPVCVTPAGDLVLCSTTTLPPVAITVNLTAVRGTGVNSNIANIAWTASSNATICTATAGPGFSTNNATSGTDNSAALDPTQNYTFTVTCTNGQGLTGTDSATITATQLGIGNVLVGPGVIVPPQQVPTVTATIRNATQGTGAISAWILAGTTATVSWTSVNATSCSITGGVYGQTGQAIQTNGTISVATSVNDYGKIDYMINCTNPTGTGQALISANVWSLSLNIAVVNTTNCLRRLNSITVIIPTAAGVSTALIDGDPITGSWNSTTALSQGIQTITQVKNMATFLSVGEPDIVISASTTLAGQTSARTRTFYAPVQPIVQGSPLCPV